MESSVGATLVRFMSAHGDPKIAIELLSDHYTGLAQMANVMSDWLGITGRWRAVQVPNSAQECPGAGCNQCTSVYYTHVDTHIYIHAHWSIHVAHCTNTYTSHRSIYVVNMHTHIHTHAHRSIHAIDARHDCAVHPHAHHSVLQQGEGRCHSHERGCMCASP